MEPRTSSTEDERTPTTSIPPGNTTTIQHDPSSKEASKPTSTPTSSSPDAESQSRPDSAGEDPFGNEANVDVHYKTCKWWHTSILMSAETISLGALSLPFAIASLGFVPGLLLLFLLGVIATYTGYLVGEFKIAYPVMHSFADCGFLILGPFGREFMAIAQLLVLIFISGAHILSFAIGLNVMSEHATCTVVFAVVGLVVCVIFTLPRTLKNVSYFSVFSCISIIVAVCIAMIGIGIQKPNMGHTVAVRKGLSVVKGLGSVEQIVLAYSGHVTYFGLFSELTDPREFKKALLLSQTFAITFYLVSASVIYYYAGPTVASPALGSASPIVRKVAYGIALPTIVIAGVINIHVACKYVYLRLCGARMAHSNDFMSRACWWAIVVVAWVVSWIIAESIPNFNVLLSLIAALFSSWFSYGLPPMLWLYQHRGRWFSSKKRRVLTVVNFLVVLLGVTIFALGMWSSGDSLADIKSGEVFSCANNWSPSVDTSNQG